MPIPFHGLCSWNHARCATWQNNVIATDEWCTSAAKLLEGTLATMPQEKPQKGVASHGISRCTVAIMVQFPVTTTCSSCLLQADPAEQRRWSRSLLEQRLGVVNIPCKGKLVHCVAGPARVLMRLELPQTSMTLCAVSSKETAVRGASSASRPPLPVNGP